MDSKRSKKTGNVVQLRKPTQSQRNSEAKWGKKVIGLGFCVVPSLLLRAQSRLGLNPTQLAVILQLCDYWWDKERKPFPSKKAMGDRLGLGPRQIQRYLTELEQADLIRREERRGGHGGKLSNYYDLSGLVSKLKELEPEFREAVESAKAQRRNVSKRGHKLRKELEARTQKN